MASQIILFSQPRSGSHLLERMLTSGQESGVGVLAHPFSGSRGKQVPWLLREDYAEGMGVKEKREYEEMMKEQVLVWEERLNQVKATQERLFVHSHPFFPISPEKMLEYIDLVTARNLPPSCSACLRNENFTIVPDTLLLQPGTIPLISIRDPRLCVPSTYRVLERMNLPHAGSRAMFIVATCSIWNCVLYNYYASHNMQPIVVDADDYMTSEAYVRQLCEKIGLDPEKARFKWEATVTGKKQREEIENGGGEIHPMLYASQNMLFESSGVDAGLAGRNVDFGKLREGWEGEFGEDAGLVGEMVELAEPGYRYLYERRWRGGE